MLFVSKDGNIFKKYIQDGNIFIPIAKAIYRKTINSPRETEMDKLTLIYYKMLVPILENSKEMLGFVIKKLKTFFELLPGGFHITRQTALRIVLPIIIIIVKMI